MTRHVVDQKRAELHESKLPFFRSTRVEGLMVPMTRITCTRRGCGQSFLVTQTFEHSTAPCPWCFKTGRISPTELEP